jgi:hypothetical protein
MSTYSKDTEDFALYSGCAHTETSSLQDDASTGLIPTVATGFIARKSLQIQASGKNCISLPVPAKELEIPIFSTSSGLPVYISIRPTQRSGSCRLVRAEDSLETSIARTTYKFGPGRHPVVHIGADDDMEAEVFEMVGKSFLTRAVCFETRRWGKFAWRYGNKTERAEHDAHNLLILESISAGGKAETRVAQLIRNEDLRTPGTKTSSAGNGGRLQMDLGEKGQVIDELVVVVTCLVMLKKEIDRLRGTQIMVLSGAASGGGI